MQHSVAIKPNPKWNFQALSLKEQNPDLKVMIAIGGWTEGVKKYSQMASTKPNRDEFVKSAVEFVQGILTTVILVYSLIFTTKSIGGNF